MYVCWECEKSCPSKDALKVHVASHGFTRVLCPWCYDQKRNFRRMVDLKTHVKAAHPNIHNKSNNTQFLKEKMGVFLADSPADYRRAIGSIPPDESPEAIFLKTAVEEWCSNFRGVVDRPISKWRQLWVQCGGLFTPEREPVLDYCYSPSKPDLDVLYSI